MLIRVDLPAPFSPRTANFSREEVEVHAGKRNDLIEALRALELEDRVGQGLVRLHHSRGARVRAPAAASDRPSSYSRLP